MDVGFRRFLERQAEELGVAENVIFLGHRSDVARLMAAADIFTMPSLEEPFGLVFLEAMAMKLPVVALSSGGTPEVVVHGTTGLLSGPGDSVRLGEHLAALIRDPALRRRMGTAGRQRVELYFTTTRMAADSAMVYERLVSPSARASDRERSEHEDIVGGRSPGRAPQPR
jgi:glycosyltransferase involved in cell wall biosynthesis